MKQQKRRDPFLHCSSRLIFSTKAAKPSLLKYFSALVLPPGCAALPACLPALPACVACPLLSEFRGCFVKINYVGSTGRRPRRRASLDKSVGRVAEGVEVLLALDALSVAEPRMRI